MITMKEYAKENGISYEAVRQSVKRYREELEGHIVKVHRTQYLDDTAVAFLDQHRSQNPVVLYTEGTVRQLQEAEQANRILDEENRRLLQELRELERWKADNAMAIAEANQTKLLLTAAEQEKKFLEGFVADAKAEIATLGDELARSEADAKKASNAAQEAAAEATELRKKLAAAQEELEDRKAHPWRYLFRKGGRA